MLESISGQAVRLILVSLLLAMVTGCMPLPEEKFTTTGPMADLSRDAGQTARVNCFLTLRDDQGPAIRLEIDSIEVFADDLRLPIISAPLKIESAAIGTSQLFLGSVAAQPGRYQRLRFAVTKAEIKKADGKYGVIAAEPFSVDVALAPNLNLNPEDSKSLLITWDVQNSLQADDTLDLDLTAIIPLRQMPVDLVFAACPDIDTVFVVRTDKNWVVDSFGLKGGPTYLAIDPDNTQFLYVLLSRDRMVKVVELSTYRVVNFFPLPLNDEPTFMAFNPEGQSAYLLDERNGYLSRLDLTTGQIVARVLLGYRPKYVAYLGGQNLLVASLSLSQNVLLLNPLSLDVIGSISTGSEPQGVAILDNQLYIAEYRDNTVSIADLAGRGTQNRLTVGFGPRRLLETDDQIYVSNYEDGSLSVLAPGQLGVIQEIYGLGHPLEMVFDQNYHRLYVADEGKAALAVIDTNSNRVVGQISLGARPIGLDVIQ